MLKVWDIPNKQKFLLLSQTEKIDFYGKVPLSYACSSKNYAEKVGKEWNEK